MGGMVQADGFLNAPQFVGYWGYGEPLHLENLLHRLLSDVGEPPIHHHQSGAEPSSCTWGIASLGIECRKRGHNAGAIGLAAAGLRNEQLFESNNACPADAWVRVDANSLILGREPFGRVPLYWAQVGRVIWFASRLKLLLPVVDTTQLSIPALYGYSCFSYVPTPLTPVTGIFSVPAGVEQRWSNDGGSLQGPIQARSLEWQQSPDQMRDEREAVHQLQTLLKDAVHHQIEDLSDEPVGVFLSGGLDSAVVSALLVQAGVNVRAYTLDFGAAGIPEYPYAQQISEFLNIPLVKVDATPQSIRQAMIPTAQALDLPFGDGVTVPLFLLGQAARQDVKVIFNGEGGDQLFAGWTNKPLIAAGLYQPEHPAGADFVNQYLHTFHRLWGYENQIFQPEGFAQIQRLNPQNWLQDALNPAFNTSLLHRLRRASLMLKGAQNIHPRATNLGFAHGLKVRSPFCDIPLAQWAFQVSGELYLQGSCEKYILKRAVESWLPPEIVWRPKRGMGAPLTSWCFNQLWHDVGIWLNPARLRQEKIWQPDLATRIVAGELGTIQGRRIGESLWLLMMWQIWQSTVLGKTSQSYSFNQPFWLPPWLGHPYLQFRRSIKKW